MNSYATNPDKNSRPALTKTFQTARANLLLMAVLSAINCIFAFLQGSIYLPFCCLAPYMLVSDGLYMTGKMPEDYYEDWAEYYGDMGFLGDEYLVVLTVISAIIILAFVLCFLLSSKPRLAPLIVSLVLYGLDALYVLYYTVIYLDPSMIIDIVFHAWVIFYLISGIIAVTKLRRLPPESAEVVDINAPTTPTYAPAEGAPVDSASTPAESAPVDSAFVHENNTEDTNKDQ